MLGTSSCYTKITLYSKIRHTFIGYLTKNKTNVEFVLWLDEIVIFLTTCFQKDKDSELAFRWRHCSITQQPLQKPIVACGLGRLYSKVSLIEGLLDRSTLPETAQHIKSLKVMLTVLYLSDKNISIV